LFNNNFGVIGYATGREQRYGEKNGWHPHMHMLLLCKDKNPDLVGIKKYMYDHYGANLKAQGLKVNKHTIDVKIIEGDENKGQAQRNAEYLTKSVIEMEIAGGHEKGSRHSYSPFQLANLYKSTGDRKHASLFMEYATATKGKKMFTISRSLLPFTDENLKSDKEIAEEKEGVMPLVSLAWNVWGEIVNRRLRGQFFSLKTGGKVMAIYSWLLEKEIMTAEQVENLEYERLLRHELAKVDAKSDPKLWKHLYGSLRPPEIEHFAAIPTQLKMEFPT